MSSVNPHHWQIRDSCPAFSSAADSLTAANETCPVLFSLCFFSLQSSLANKLKFAELQAFKERFEKGEGDIQVEKTEIDIRAGDLSDIKSAFERADDDSDMTPEERAELKKKHIEEEFLRYKLARRAAAQREAAEKAAGEEGGGVEAGADIEVGTIKDRFETGEAFKAEHKGLSFMH
ncbi:unnamed protein product [Gongylonema pulchrum]|uniref:FAM192A_Fyv6_N domain-containing protein n=1 Tax=Gongylonema pulchrum TaxID=637853 RepID=A0A183DD80_9BILA|nr:unnamed protein product [Gongylonema pulchrum]